MSPHSDPKRSKLEAQLLQRIASAGLPEPLTELLFAREFKRKWRFDFAWPDHKLAVEVDGGTWNQGRHTRALGFREDCIKLNTAAILGWTVLRFDERMVTDGRAIAFIKHALGLGFTPGEIDKPWLNNDFF